MLMAKCQIGFASQRGWITTRAPEEHQDGGPLYTTLASHPSCQRRMTEDAKQDVT